MASLVLRLVGPAALTLLVASPAEEPRPLTGGPFEPSGVAHVLGTNGVLFVDDDSPRLLFWTELTARGIQKGRALPLPLGADVTDPEAITFDGKYFYVVGSQSKTWGYDGDGLVRFEFDAVSRRTRNVTRVRGLKAWLLDRLPELRGPARRPSDAVINIEGLAWDPNERRLLLGLREPVIAAQAIVIPIALREKDGAFALDNLTVSPIIRLPVGGAGIRSLEYDAPTDSFRVITGASMYDEIRDFRVLDWDGRSDLRERARYDARLKPEGYTRATLDGQSVAVIVFDTGRFEVVD